MEQKQKRRRGVYFPLLKAGVPLVFAFVLLLVSLRAFAWFYNDRRIAAVAEISDPTAIFINAGNREDIRYLDLGGIDVETSDLYKDFVFCVRGNNVTGYKLQLAYTTNNQFDYELYPATLTADSSSVPANPESLVIYDTHVGGSARQYYYAPAGASPLRGVFLNYDSTASEKLAKNNDVYHSRTYTPSDAASPYLNRHKYAIPLYWQTSGAQTPVLDAHSDFCDYFILRVKWDGEARNDKETDIVYIAAKNVSI